jgi:hypothetical protein
LRLLTRNAPLAATGAHISVVAHITADELRRDLDRTEVANGLLNRFLLLCVRRSKELPDGGHVSDEVLAPLVERLRVALGAGRAVTVMRRDAAARDLWHAEYTRLSEGRPGLLGAVTSRAEAQVVRLACVYALLDNSATVCEPHLRAALALWDFASRSAGFLFTESLGDPLADRLLQELRARPGDGMSRNEMFNLFGRNRRKARSETRAGAPRSVGGPRVGLPRLRRLTRHPLLPLPHLIPSLLETLL